MTKKSRDLLPIAGERTPPIHFLGNASLKAECHRDGGRSEQHDTNTYKFSHNFLPPVRRVGDMTGHMTLKMFKRRLCELRVYT